jgi:hypothetical protein
MELKVKLFLCFNGVPRYEGVFGRVDLALDRVNGQLHAPAALPPRKEPTVPMEDRRLGGPQRRSGHDGGGKNSQRLPGLEPPIIQTVAHRYTTELFRLLIYPCLA